MNKISYTLSDIYTEYAKQAGSLPKSKFMLVKEVLKRISRAIIVEKFAFRIPHRLGFLRVMQDSTPVEKLNYTKRGSNNKVYPFLNRHTGGKMFTFRWQKRNSYCSFTNRYKYALKVVDDKTNRYIGKRGLAEYIQNCANDPKVRDYSAVEKPKTL